MFLFLISMEKNALKVILKILFLCVIIIIVGVDFTIPIELERLKLYR